MYKVICKTALCLTIVLLCIFNAYAGGWMFIDGYYYWINDDGSHLTGFIFDNNHYFYADKTGKVQLADTPGTYKLIYDENYQGVFYVDEFGRVSMNITTEPHWGKTGGVWYHYGKNGVLDRNKWIVDTDSKKIYRVDYDGKLCHGWVADPDTHIEYYYNTDPDNGCLLYDSSGTPYDEMYQMIVSTVNLDEGYTDTIRNAPSKIVSYEK